MIQDWAGFFMFLGIITIVVLTSAWTIKENRKDARALHIRDGDTVSNSGVRDNLHSDQTKAKKEGEI